MYGDLRLQGLDVKDTRHVADNPDLRLAVRDQIRASAPAVVAFLVCARAEAEKYRAGAEAFIDRVFFQEEVDECLAFLKDVISKYEA